ncbi:hypothetical protein DPMN_156616 [Dreissena polymorpha]|uniref:Uncharacterized protein n=1 Tax=Dreissena polymorpha TaxID=45954 RepID=A0A9D4FSM9_DREPO|nr:hypothetical protein DPMN_156616 [Dreissena polymorpha]
MYVTPISLPQRAYLKVLLCTKPDPDPNIQTTNAILLAELSFVPQHTRECDEPQCKRVDKCYERLLGKITTTFAYV